MIDTSWLPGLLIGAGYIILIFAYWQYIKIVKNTGSGVIPNPASWAVFSAISAGNAIVLWGKISFIIWFFPIIMSLAQILIARESYKKKRGHLESSDEWALGIGLLGVILWILSKQFDNQDYSWMSVITLVMADSVGFYPTLRDAWQRPYEDDPITWFVFMLVGILVLLGLWLDPKTNSMDILYPCYELALASSVFFTLIIRRHLAIKL